MIIKVTRSDFDHQTPPFLISNWKLPNRFIVRRSLLAAKETMSSRHSYSLLGLRRPAFFPRGARMFIFACWLGGGFLFLGGWFAASSQLAGEARQEWLLSQFDAALPAELPAKLTDLENAATGLPYSRYLLATGFAYAAERLPEQQALRQRAKLEAEAARAGFADAAPHSYFENQLHQTPANARRALPLLLATLRMETGDETGAENLLLAGINGQGDDAPLAFLPDYYNALGYLYATAKSATLRRPETALHYAQLAAPDWEKCDNAAFLDTLAMAYLANGEKEKAAPISRRAVALSAPFALTEVLDNFAKITE